MGLHSYVSDNCVHYLKLKKTTDFAGILYANMYRGLNYDNPCMKWNFEKKGITAVYFKRRKYSSKQTCSTDVNLALASFKKENPK